MEVGSYTRGGGEVGSCNDPFAPQSVLLGCGYVIWGDGLSKAWGRAPQMDKCGENANKTPLSYLCFVPQSHVKEPGNTARGQEITLVEVANFKCATPFVHEQFEQRG